ncbi:MAG: hypothetical protein ACK40O_04625 [Allosphingosinicella sp.]
MTYDEPADVPDAGTSEARQEYIYFYHITAPKGLRHGKLDVYFGENEGNGPVNEAAIPRIWERFQNRELEHKGDNVNDWHWKEPGYLVFACEDATRDLVDVTFHFGSTDGPNHSFGPTRTFALNNGAVTGVFCKNLRRNWRNGPLCEGQRELFHVTFHFQPPENKPRLHEETGTNTGP